MRDQRQCVHTGRCPGPRGSAGMAYRVSLHAATPLQAARLEVGWKQTQTIRALQDAASANGTAIAEGHSLKTMLSRWENGQEIRDPVYQRLLCRIYCKTPEELGFAATDNRPAT